MLYLIISPRAGKQKDMQYQQKQMKLFGLPISS